MYQRSMRFDRRVWGDTNILAATDPPFASSEPHQSIASKAPGLLLPVPFQPAHLAGCSYKTDKNKTPPVVAFGNLSLKILSITL